MGKITELDQVGAGLYRDGDGNALDSMMAVGKPPWHYAENSDMVTLVEDGERVTSKTVNEIAGLDWLVYTAIPYIQLPNGEFKEVSTRTSAEAEPKPDFIMNVRSDNDRVLGVVQERYTIFQNSEAPKFLDRLVDDGDASFVTAGSLYGGAVVWWLMKLPEDVLIAGESREKIETYLLLTNTHDGSASRTISVVPIRVVCQNTLSWALKSALRQFSVRHTPGAEARALAEARKALEIGWKYTEELAKVGEQMLDYSISDKEFDRFLNSVVPVPTPIKDEVNVPGPQRGTRVIREGTWNQRGISLALNTQAKIRFVYTGRKPRQSKRPDAPKILISQGERELIRACANQTHLRGTLWGAVQAVQFYSDHLATVKKTRNTDKYENRFRRLVEGRTLGNEGFQRALTMLND